MNQSDSSSPFPSNLFADNWEASYQRMMRGCQALPNGDPTKLQQALTKLHTGKVDFSELPGPTGRGKIISVPLQKLDKCDICAKTTNLRLCSSCASVIYCSKECQKLDWKQHKNGCAQTSQINLKFFYPFIAYLFDFLRRTPPKQQREFPQDTDPFILTMFEKLGRGGGSPQVNAHPALCRKILKAPTPGIRKSTQSETSLHHTVVLGIPHNLEISQIPDLKKLASWWRGKPMPQAMRLYSHIMRESYILEVTITICLILLSEIYSTHLARKPSDADIQDHDQEPWERRPCYRMEYGHSPVSDFGICKGRIQGKESRLQTWTYYEPKSNVRTTIGDPNNHYWLYFRTIKGEEIILDCCSSSYGMETYVDASHCIRKFPEIFRGYGSARTPASFRTAQDKDYHPYDLIEEKRFSVMQNKRLHRALGWELFGGRDTDQHAIVREFISEVSGRPCTQEEEDRVRDYRMPGALMLNQVLGGKYWKDWGRPTIHSRNDMFDPGNSGQDIFAKGSPEDPECEGQLNGLLGMFADAMGLNGRN